MHTHLEKNRYAHKHTHTTHKLHTDTDRQKNTHTHKEDKHTQRKTEIVYVKDHNFFSYNKLLTHFYHFFNKIMIPKYYLIIISSSLPLPYLSLNNYYSYYT